MSDLPHPLTPPDCDLRGFEWMQLWGHRMFTSSWYRAARKDGRGGIASLKLYWSAMLQCPAGSLPNDEEELCMLADFGEDMRAWARHRPVAMHGFVLCADNRWYHPVVAEQVLDAYDRKLKSARTREVDRERLKRWRANHNGAPPPDKPNGQTHPEPPRETRFETPAETHHIPLMRMPETRFETQRETGCETPDETSRATTRQDQTRQETLPQTPSQGREGGGTPAEPGTPPARRADGTNPRAVGTNPREIGGNPRKSAINPRAMGTNPRAKPPRSGFKAVEQRLATIEGTAEEVAEMHEFASRLRLVAGGSNG